MTEMNQQPVRIEELERIVIGHLETIRKLSARIAELEAQSKQMHINFNFVLDTVETAYATLHFSEAATTWQDRVRAVKDVFTGKRLSPLRKRIAELERIIREVQNELADAANLLDEWDVAIPSAAAESLRRAIALLDGRMAAKENGK